MNEENKKGNWEKELDKLSIGLTGMKLGTFILCWWALRAFGIIPVVIAFFVVMPIIKSIYGLFTDIFKSYADFAIGEMIACFFVLNLLGMNIILNIILTFIGVSLHMYLTHDDLLHGDNVETEE